MTPDPIEAEIVAPAPDLAQPAPVPPAASEIVVLAATAAAARRPQGARHLAQRHMLTYPNSGKTVELIVSDREFNIVTRYIDTLNVRTVASEFGIGIRTVRNLIQSERLNNYVAHKVRQKAGALGLTLDKVMAKLNGAIDGVDPLDETQLAAIGHAARLLKPALSGLTFNQQNNFGGAAPAAVSPYSSMDRAELIHEMREIVAESSSEGAGE